MNLRAIQGLLRPANGDRPPVQDKALPDPPSDGVGKTQAAQPDDTAPGADPLAAATQGDAGPADRDRTERPEKAQLQIRPAGSERPKATWTGGGINPPTDASPETAPGDGPGLTDSAAPVSPPDAAPGPTQDGAAPEPPDTSLAARTTEAAFDRRMLEYLVCPVTHAALTYDPVAQELISRAVHLAFPIRNGIPVLLASEAREVD